MAVDFEALDFIRTRNKVKNHERKMTEQQRKHELFIDGRSQLDKLANAYNKAENLEFKKLYNDSPAHYIRVRKLEKAKSLLKASEESISNIAYDCGFSDISHFSKVFKSEYGVAPSEAR